MSHEPLSVAVLSLGSNVPDSREQVLGALAWLRERVARGLRCSELYSTPALRPGKPRYLNAVAVAETAMQLAELNAALKQHEAACGRDEAMRRQGLVPIDLDVVMWNGAVLRDKDYNQQYFQIGWKLINNSKI